MENYLSTITNYLLTQSWQIAVLAVVITAVNLALKNKSAHVRYLLWLIVLAKCLVPPLVTIPLAILPQDKMPEPTLISSGEMPAVNVEMADTVTSEPIALPSLPVTSPTIMERLARVTARQWLGFGWIVGVAAFLLFALVKALRTNFWLWRQRKLLPAELQTGIENLFSDLDFRTFPKAWLVEGIGQPFVWGLLRGGIYLPADFVKVNSAGHRRSVLGHELSHVIRYDAAINLLQIIAQAVFWFHPFVWWANRKIRAEREKCCDEMAIAHLGAKAKDYSDAIVNILISEHESTRPVPSLAVAGPVKNIEERIKTMLRPGKKFYKRPSLVAATVVLLLALFTVPTDLVLTARAQETKTASPSDDKPIKTLHYAAATGDVQQVKLNISKGTDINEKSSTGDTPLHYAVRHENKDVAELLIKEGADVNAKNKKGETPVHIALIKNNKELLDLLIAEGSKLSCIHLSAYQGDLDKVRHFVEQGTDVDARDSNGATALHYAAVRGHQDVVEFLIVRGADVNAKDKDYGFTPLDRAAKGGHNKGVVELLITKGANVNARDKWGWTPLDTAVWHGHKETAELLIEKGANVNSRYAWGGTPLIWAAQKGHTGVAELLIAKGANVNAIDNDGRSPLMHAAQNGHEDTVKLLIGKEADINMEAYFSRGTVLAQAAIGGHMNVVKVLLAKGADVNAGTRTPLHEATRLGRKDMVTFLIANGADVNAKDNVGRGPLWWAKDKGHEEIVKLLRKHGAKE